MNLCFIYMSRFIIIYLNIEIKPRAKINTLYMCLDKSSSSICFTYVSRFILSKSLVQRRSIVAAQNLFALAFFRITSAHYRNSTDSRWPG
jgi:hypothetical protein